MVDSDDKLKARLNCIKHLLSLIDYRDEEPEPIELPPRSRQSGYVRPPLEEQTFVFDHYAGIEEAYLEDNHTDCQ